MVTQNPLFTATDLLVKAFQSHVLTNTLIVGETSKIDANKDTVFPVVNIELAKSSNEGEMIFIDYKITILDQLDVNDNSEVDKIYLSNKMDIFDETFAILQTTINTLIQTQNVNDIDVDRTSDITFINNFGIHSLYGVQTEVQLSLENKLYNCI